LKALEEKTTELHQHDAVCHECLFTGVFKCIVDALKPGGKYIQTRWGKIPKPNGLTVHSSAGSCYNGCNFHSLT